MRKKLSIRGGLALTIAGYTLLLILIVTSCVVALYSSNESLRAMYSDDTASLLHLKTSSESLLLVRGDLNEIEQLISAGKPATEQIAEAHKLLAQSNQGLDAYRALHAPDAAEKALVDTMQSKRGQLISSVFDRALKQLDEENLVDFLSTQREAPASLFADYQRALNALEDFQVRRQQDRFERAHTRFIQMLWGFGIAGVFALCAGVFAQRILAHAIVEPIQSAVGYFGRIAAGDLTCAIAVESDNEMGYLLNALRDMQTSLVKTVCNVRASTDAIVLDAHAIAVGNSDLSVRTETQADSLQEAAASVEELTATVRQNAENARGASELAIGASDIALRGGDVVTQVVATMDAISGSSSKIVGIVGVIEGIAFQTNILALNAAVEAARAGEQGRGFAVVAAEVRNLAQRSASAAKEIKELIGDSAKKVRDGSELVGRAGTTMGEVVGAVQRVRSIMAEISLASTEQTAGIELVNAVVMKMEDMTQQNAALVEQASAAAASLGKQSHFLKESVAVFRVQDSDAVVLSDR